MKIELSGIIAIVALAWSIWTHVRQNKQKKLIDECIIKDYKKKEQESKKAKFKVDTSRISEEECLIKITNTGQAVARNVRVGSSGDGYSRLINSNIPSINPDKTHIFNAPHLSRDVDNQKNFFMRSANRAYFPDKFWLKLVWNDEFKNNREDNFQVVMP